MMPESLGGNLFYREKGFGQPINNLRKKSFSGTSGAGRISRGKGEGKVRKGELGEVLLGKLISLRARIPERGIEGVGFG